MQSKGGAGNLRNGEPVLRKALIIFNEEFTNAAGKNYDLSFSLNRHRLIHLAYCEH